MEVVNINEKFEQFQDFWNPRIIGELNGQQVKIARLKDEFIMHQHEQEDELFLVIEGVLEMEFKDQIKRIHPMEFLIVPKGTPHRPKAIGEVKVLLFEPKTTLNTGEFTNEFTKEKLDRV
ncbi:cupin domain-containing protein [Aquimarina sp. ERC-38]|uniref:cupin domain-containing protein n=1 Tax=Aquimarina sp. ERC-38 TaxID=2949996 RepID=UPI002245DA11|nr:cupin domain-containing protein [Aquimarina sp. ERC-38]UZO79918.1 cupin domain-containing protein [Aquimarina sp. ERC-38]